MSNEVNQATPASMIATFNRKTFLYALFTVQLAALLVYVDALIDFQ